MKEKKSGSSLFERISTFVVDTRTLFFLLYIFAAIFCVFAMGLTKVENDVTTYLPADTETRQGLVAMNEHFADFGMARVMVSNITYETAQEIHERISGVEGVMMVTFDNTAEHYKDAAALYNVNFEGATTDPATIQAMDAIRGLLQD